MIIKETVALKLQCEIQDKRIKFGFTWDDVEGTGIFYDQTDPGSEPTSCRVKVTIRSIAEMQLLEGVCPTIQQNVGALKNCLNLNYILVISTLGKPLSRKNSLSFLEKKNFSCLQLPLSSAIC